MTPQELLGAARDLMQRPGASLDGIWPRAAALLARQALEAAMAELWAAHRQTAALSASTMRSCHYHPYELAPTAAELTTWLGQAAHLITQLHAAGGSDRSVSARPEY